MKISQSLAISFLIVMASPAFAQPPGHWSFTVEYIVASYTDLRPGFGIQDPINPNNPCTFRQIGLRFSQPVSGTWELDQNLGTNLNGPAIGVTDQGLGNGGLDLGIPCPLAGSPPSNLFLAFAGLNWYSARHESFTQILLCTQQVFPSSSPGCLPTQEGLRLIAAACGDGLVSTPDYRSPAFGGSTTFYHDYKDGKGKYAFGTPFDQLQMKNDAIGCTTYHTHNYSGYVQDFDSASASLAFYLIKNEEVVHSGQGSTYMAICWQLGYDDYTGFPNTAPLRKIARTHDWKLILDAGAPGDWLDALASHYGGAQPGDSGNPMGAVTAALRGFYSDGTTKDGQNGFGPCGAGPHSSPDAKRPAPII